MAEFEKSLAGMRLVLNNAEATALTNVTNLGAATTCLTSALAGVLALPAPAAGAAAAATAAAAAPAAAGIAVYAAYIWTFSALVQHTNKGNGVVILAPWPALVMPPPACLFGMTVLPR